MSRTCDNFSYVLNTCKRNQNDKNLTFKTGRVDGCACAEILSLIEQGLIDTTPLITHRYSLEEIEITLKKGKIGVSISTANRRIEDWKVSG